MEETKIERRRRLQRIRYKKRKEEDPNFMNKRMKGVYKYLKTPKGKFQAYKQSARVRNLLFELTQDEFLDIISKQCFYCNTNIKIGIDRKDNSIGYTLDNCISCCKECNYMKGSTDVNNFINKCKGIAALHSNV